MRARDTADGAAVHVRVEADGGVRVTIDGDVVVELGPPDDAGSRRWFANAGGDVGTVAPGPRGLGGHVLCAKGDDGNVERARTTPLGGPDAGETTLLLEDGRAFRLRALPGATRAALLSWETPSAYFEIEPDHGEGWTIVPTVAGRASGWDTNMLALIAAELVADRARERE